ncbi:LPS export ABC transporter permease LptG [Sphingomonas profundi]|uniref:LPS export ABC transporter permease LptG n=1 Tax=Alterirhizorhabdus profundi TaxID=2681549 RepID=UPI0012E87C06|nr:LPS export ABC transporter permease LptG [Sphingomonas profundi]
MSINPRFFASPTITWYMAKIFLVRTFAVLAGLVLILQTLDLLGESGNILAYPGNGDAQLWHYVSLRAPQIVARFLPFSVLLGSLITLATLNQNSEIISMKAAGVSAHQILAPLIVASLFVAAGSFWFNDRIVARATATLTAWDNADYGPVPVDRGIASNVWVRDGDDLIHAATASGRGPATRLSDVTIYDRSGGALQTIISGARAAQADGGWRLLGPTRFDVARGTRRQLPAIVFGRGITPDRFTLADVDADERSFGALRIAIADLQAAGRPTGELEAGLWHKLSGPLSAMLMPLLAGVAAFGLARSGHLFVRAVIGMALGFTYFVVDNFALAMGNLGAYPPLLAAWAPPLLFLLIGEVVLIRTEE